MPFPVPDLLPTLPANFWLALGTFAAIIGLYMRKTRSLRSSYEHGQHLSKLEGKTVQQDGFGIRVDTVEFEEQTGPLYRLKRYALRPIDGTTYINIRTPGRVISEKVLETDTADMVFEIQECDVECMNWATNPSYTVMVFKLDTAEYADLKIFVASLAGYFARCEQKLQAM
jgi:hypothetical protein